MSQRNRMWGENIRARRIALGLLQGTVADQLGVAQATVSRWEKGLKVPSDDNRWRLAVILDADVTELFPPMEPDSTFEPAA